jgi:hypothetical protein
MRNIYNNAFLVSVCLQPPQIGGNEVADYIKTYRILEFLGTSENGKNEVVKLVEP